METKPFPPPPPPAGGAIPDVPALTSITEAAAVPTLLQGPTPLRESLIWDLQSNFYAEAGLRAWTEALVPSFVTSNAFIAAAYARVLLAWLRDWAAAETARGSPGGGEPVHIIEVGAGHGRLSFLILRELLAARSQWPLLPGAAPGAAPFRWVVTDACAAMLPFWRNHVCLAPFFEAGLADCAVWDAETQPSFTLAVSGVVLGPGSLRQPAVAVANYVFDTLRQDAFRLVEGQLQRALASVYAEAPAAGEAVPSSSPAAAAIRRMRVSWEYRPVTPEAAFPGDPALQTVLRVYALRMRSASLLVPVGGIAAVRAVAALADGRALVLAGDKAYNHEEELVGLRDPHIAVHGSFSFMVNFHAVRLLALAAGGFSLHTPQLDGFKVSAFVLGCSSPPLPPPPAALPPAAAAAAVASAADLTVSADALAFPALLCAWADSMDTFGPDNLASLQRCVRDEIAAPSLKTALATIRLAAWDADVFYKFKAVLIDKAPTAGDKQAADLWADAWQVAERYFPLQASKDVAFELGRVAMGVKRHADAIRLFEASAAACGDHHVTRYNIGICHWYRGEWLAAQAAFDRSIEMRPDYADAAQWRAKVAAKIEGERFVAAHAAGGAAAAAAEQ